MNELTPDAIKFLNDFAVEGAKHDDRWLMLFMFGLVVLGAAIAIWYLSRQNERQRSSHIRELEAQRAAHATTEESQRDSHTATTKTLIDVLLTQNTKLVEVVTRNTDAFEINSKILQEVNRTLGKGAGV